MTKQIELDLRIGANFEQEILLATEQSGRTHRADIRVSVGDVFVQLHFETGDGIEATGNAITLTKNALETGALSLDVDSAHWVIDIESVGATEADVRREARGLVLVTRDITRLSEPTAAANASKLLTYSLNDGQTLTEEEQAALQTKIGVSGGGSASAVLYTAQTLTAPQQTQALTNQGVTAAGRAVAQAADAAAQRTALGLGTAATTSASAYATAPQGTDDRTASGLRTATTVVALSAGAAPSSGQVLTATGSAAATWQTPSGGGGTPGGSDKQVQYNNAGTFGGSSSLTYQESPVAELKIAQTSASKLQLLAGSFGLQSADVDNGFLTVNCYFDGSIKRIATGSGGYIQFAGGVMYFNHFDSGLAGSSPGITRSIVAFPSGEVSIGASSIMAMLGIVASIPERIGAIVKGAASQTADLQQWQSSAGAVLGRIKADGSLQPASMTDAAATNDSIYYSTTASKLVYKDSGGTVNALY